MEKITWDQTLYSVGHTQLDRQHQEIIRLLNSLVDIAKQPHDSQDLHQVIKRMQAYASFHFDAEESILQQSGYDSVEQQHDDHSTYNETLSNLIASQKAAEDILIFLLGWWNSHILQEDMKFKEHLLLNT